MIRHRDDRDEAGTTLAEMMVSMGIMTIFLTMFTSAMVLLYQHAGRTEAVAATSNQLNSAFNQFDKTVRYASAISTPNATQSAGGNYYVELQTTNTGATICTQFQLNASSQVLRSRTWTPSNGAATSLTSFTTVATNLAAPASGSAFVVTTRGSYQQLTATWTSALNGQATSQSAVTFTALNSAGGSTQTSSSACQEAGRP